MSPRIKGPPGSGTGKGNGGRKKDWKMCRPAYLNFTPANPNTLLGEPQVVLDGQACTSAPMAIFAFLIITAACSLTLFFMQAVVNGELLLPPLPGARKITLLRRMFYALKRVTVIICTVCFLAAQIVEIFPVTDFMAVEVEDIDSWFLYPIFLGALWRITEVGWMVYTTKKYILFCKALHIESSIKRMLTTPIWIGMICTVALAVASFGFSAYYWSQIITRATRSAYWAYALRLADPKWHSLADRVSIGYEGLTLAWALIIQMSVIYIWRVRDFCPPPGWPTDPMNLGGRVAYWGSEAYALYIRVCSAGKAVAAVATAFGLKALMMLIVVIARPYTYHHFGPAGNTDAVVFALYRVLMLAIGALTFFLPIELSRLTAEKNQGGSQGEHVGEGTTYVVKADL